MELNFKGTPAELHETLHYLCANVRYWNGNERAIKSARPMTEQEIEAEVLRDGWLADAIKSVRFSLDSCAEPPFATIGR